VVGQHWRLKTRIQAGPRPPRFPVPGVARFSVVCCAHVLPAQLSRRPPAVLYMSRQGIPSDRLRSVRIPIPPSHHGEITSSAPVPSFIAPNEPGRRGQIAPAIPAPKRLEGIMT
jgi:hypothetical protein